MAVVEGSAPWGVWITPMNPRYKSLGFYWRIWVS